MLKGAQIPSLLNNSEASCSLMNLSFLLPHPAYLNNSMVFPFFVFLIDIWVLILCFSSELQAVYTFEFQTSTLILSSILSALIRLWCSTNLLSFSSANLYFVLILSFSLLFMTSLSIGQRLGYYFIYAIEFTASQQNNFSVFVSFS